MNTRLSGLSAFILNGLLDHQNACTDHYTACPLAGVLSMFLSPVALCMVLYWRGRLESNQQLAGEVHILRGYNPFVYIHI